MFSENFKKSCLNTRKSVFFSYAIRLSVLGAMLYQTGIVHAEIHGTVTATSNYVWRMYSKSNDKPAIQANLDYQHALGFYTGVSTSSFDIGPSEFETESGLPIGFKDNAQVEIVPYVGWSFKFFEDWRADLQYSHYFYDGLVYGKESDYDEFYLFLHYKDLLTAQASYVKDFYGIKGDAFFYELTGRYPITDYLQISSTLGYAHTQGILLDDYEYWNVGLTGAYKFVSLDLRYYGARETKIGDTLAVPEDHANTLTDTVVISISVGF
jgi:uncharacterized protein (TIGR02001 family)